LHSEYIIQLHGIVNDNAYCHYQLAFEYMNGGTLDSYIMCQRRRKKDVLKIEIALAIARGLHELHSHKIVHRDLRSRKILLSTDGRVKLSDFGFTRHNPAMEPHYSDWNASVLSSESDIEIASIGSSAQSNYTPVAASLWTAPEALYDDHSYKIENDIYSFGVILIELDTLKAPSSCNIKQITEVEEGLAEFQLGSNCEPWYKVLVERCLSFDPKKRPDSFDIVRELERYQSRQSVMI
ncbi:kinase, partial [Thraustotheca clavata]